LVWAKWKSPAAALISSATISFCDTTTSIWSDELVMFDVPQHVVTATPTSRARMAPKPR